MFKKVELWIVGIITIFFIILIIFVSGVLRDAYLNKNKTPEFLRNNIITIAEIPKNVYLVISYLKGDDINAVSKLQKHKDKKRFEQFIENKRNALLVLPRYDHSLSRSVVDIVDLNNFEVIHTYSHNISEMNKKIINTKKFQRIKIDSSPKRFIYQNPLLFEDGSLIGHYGPSYKIDFCSNLQWINDKELFHHISMSDFEGNIWMGGTADPKSKYVKKYVNKFEIKDFVDDTIIKINTHGEILFNKSVIEILIENRIADKQIFTTGYYDPIHLNDIEPALNDTEYWKQGDVFISIRNQSAIIHYRPISNKVINYITGPFSAQHDVDIISDKEISIFNNNNFFVDNEYSEVLVYNLETKKFKKLLNDQLQNENFKTISEGLSHTFKGGALMVEEQNHGRIILFNSKGEKEWEFVNKDSNGDIGFISWSRVIEDDTFIKKFKLLVKNKKCLN